ncbi:hypothetical protein [Fusobacterium varium]|uniref:hypothetical protein n=2 Tax=Fusobacterium TaxID=848 RepID=UPI002432D654|nr:hypothetical protein [Fusobacterium varium]MCF0171468.1 hypothetical protein [Fusobacterium varium]
MGFIIDVLNLITDIFYNRKEIKLKDKALIMDFYKELLSSLPSLDCIITQADYLTTEYGLGGMTPAENRIGILKKRIEYGYEKNNEEWLEYLIKRHEKYMEYWKTYNNKIENLINDSTYNFMRAICSQNVINHYTTFRIAFYNEHNYCGPIIDTKLISELLFNVIAAVNYELRI